MLRSASLLRMLFLLACAALLAGCKKDPNLEFIQGSWYYNDTHLATTPGESHLTDNWEFDDGVFYNSTCCFVRGALTGSYRLVESEDNRLILEIFSLEGQIQGVVYSESDTAEIVVEIDREQGTLEINYGGPYYRVSPSAPSP